jgi:hypothetical protein
MQAQTRTVGEFTVTVREATALDGMRRQILRGNAIQAADTDEALQIMRLIVYPDLTCCLVKEQSRGLPDPLTFEAFCELPVGLTDAWNEAVYTVNPQFLGIEPDSKKVLQPGAGSETSHKRSRRATSPRRSSSTSLS